MNCTRVKIKKLLIQLKKKQKRAKTKKEEEKIYSKTTFLDGDAVTWLVISSPHNEIRPHKECFPFMGCFPYLGFFKLNSAKNYISDMEEEGFSTYMRPVYAYSTLGYFTDNILSSFFVYKEFELAELTFHELFHTIFFAKDEVDFNENLANYFGREMANEYFNMSDDSIKKSQLKREKHAIINQKVSELALQLNKEYKLHHNLTRKSSREILDKFIINVFYPSVKSKCEEIDLSLQNCLPLKKKWNNASLASYLTYEKNVRQIEFLRNEKKMTLKDYFGYIYKEYEKYLASDTQTGFDKFLFQSFSL